MLIPPEELAGLYWSEQWLRTSVWHKDKGCLAYLIDTRSRMIVDINIEKSLLEAADNYGKSTPGQLNDNPAFSGNIFPGALFLNRLQSMSSLQRQSLFLDPDILLTIPKPLSRIGLSPPPGQNDLGLIGFEFLGDDGYFTTVYPLSLSAFDQLSILLTTPVSSLPVISDRNDTADSSGIIQAAEKASP